MGPRPAAAGPRPRPRRELRRATAPSPATSTKEGSGQPPGPSFFRSRRPGEQQEGGEDDADAARLDRSGVRSMMARESGVRVADAGASHAAGSGVLAPVPRVEGAGHLAQSSTRPDASRTVRSQVRPTNAGSWLTR